MTNAIDKVFSQKKGMKLMTHVIAGYPSREGSLELVEMMAGHGADLVEIQIPFSDPLADGPTIMAANQAALDSGILPDDCFEIISRLSGRVSVPLLVMTYGNIPFRMGWDDFAEACRKSGASGAIIPDLPHDEPLPGLHRAFEKRSVHFIHLVSPGISQKRLGTIATRAGGFLYTTLRVGITGAARRLEPAGLEFLDRVRTASDLPIAAGFGVSAPEHIDALRGKVDAVIIGSHILNLLRDQGMKGVESFLQLCREHLDKEE